MEKAASKDVTCLISCLKVDDQLARAPGLLSRPPEVGRWQTCIDIEMWTSLRQSQYCWWPLTRSVDSIARTALFRLRSEHPSNQVTTTLFGRPRGPAWIWLAKIWAGLGVCVQLWEVKAVLSLNQLIAVGGNRGRKLANTHKKVKYLIAD